MNRFRTIAPFFLAAALLAGCAAIQPVGLPSPESQITAGAQAGTAATDTIARLSAANKITLSQTKSYRAMVAAPRDALKDANEELVACRVKTGSNEKTKPDPCWAGITDVVRIALENLATVKKSLDSK